ncbi:hypothetical protein [Thalassospira indica]|uniref:Uncharacterized protein n=1 Tax=Thalassospira indica TaxID=1891279 RepID=A0ABN5NGW4_9PROT|nr:hypothetical protein [Thalassospira indica]AXO14469.1 hypothetical protein DY252_09740 [Thalassospira indica]OAZ11425.1 hypothetical protein TH15_18340 [Thalassospira profundimaris]
MNENSGNLYSKGVLRLVNLLSALIFFGSVTYVVYFAFNYEQMPAPAELGIPYFLILSAVCALLINANHERLSSIFTKIGPVEFREMLEEQTEEANEVILGIEERFEYIEHSLKENDDPAGWQHMFSHDRISKLIINYLDFSNNKPISALRLQRVAGKQHGYEELATTNSLALRTTLSEMVRNGTLTTSLSARGNRLYQLAN